MWHWCAFRAFPPARMLVLHARRYMCRLKTPIYTSGCMLLQSLGTRPATLSSRLTAVQCTSQCNMLHETIEV